MALPEVYSILSSVKRLFFFEYGKFFLARIEGLSTEDGAHCADCKAHPGMVVILGFMYQMSFNCNISLLFLGSKPVLFLQFAELCRESTRPSGSHTV